jgi:hypothetical protein
VTGVDLVLVHTVPELKADRNIEKRMDQFKNNTHSGVLRFMCNRTTPLREKNELRPSRPRYSPLEISIENAIS